MNRIATTFAALAALLLGQAAAGAQELQNFRIPSPVVSPELTESTITFRLRAPQASDVRVMPSWLGYGPDAMEAGRMVKGEDGVWSVSFDRPASELYTYTFMVDGVSTLDPANIFVQRDGTRFMSAVLVDGGLADLYKECPRAGNLEQVWYYSATLGMNRRMYVYTPYGYDRNDGSKQYPVLYLLHGGGGDEDAWTTLGRTCQILDNLIDRGEAVPMLVVMPNGNPSQRAARTLMVPENPDIVYPNNFDNYDSLPADIVPYIEKNYNVIKDRSGRALAGLSMGGGQTFYTGFRNVDMFSGLGMFSSGLLGSLGSIGTFDAEKEMPGLISTPEKYNRMNVIYISCGEQDERIKGNKDVVDLLRSKGYDVVWETCEGGHEWRVWRINLASFARKIFK